MKLYPSLRYKDAKAAHQWLQEAFGFEPVALYEDDNGGIAHAEMRWGSDLIMFGSARNDQYGERTGQGWIYATCPDPDALYERAKAAGAEVTMELTDQDYGSRDFAVRDLEGNRWSFGTYEPTQTPRIATFTDNELDYLKGQRLARLATADAKAAPHVVPVGFRLAEDASAIDVGGHNFAKSKKYRDLKANPRVAIVVDDLASVDPWTPRGIEVRGTAEVHDSGGVEKFGPGGWDEAWVRILPERVISWGIEAPPFTEGSFTARSTGRA